MYIYTKDFLTFGVDLLRYYYYMKKTETQAFFKIKFKKHFLFLTQAKKNSFLFKKSTGKICLDNRQFI